MSRGISCINFGLTSSRREHFLCEEIFGTSPMGFQPTLVAYLCFFRSLLMLAVTFGYFGFVAFSSSLLVVSVLQLFFSEVSYLLVALVLMLLALWVLVSLAVCLIFLKPFRVVAWE
jgi:poly(A) polymerase Pap1